MTQGYRGPSRRSRRLDMNWLNFEVAPHARGSSPSCSPDRAAVQPGPGHRGVPGRTGAPNVHRVGESTPRCTNHAPETGRHRPCGRRLVHETHPVLATPLAAPRPRSRGGDLIPHLDLLARTHDAPATRRSAGASMEAGHRGHDDLSAAPAGSLHTRPQRPGCQSRSRSRRWGRSLRFAERPPWSRRRSISWPEMRVSARRLIVSLDRSAGSSTSEKS